MSPIVGLAAAPDVDPELLALRQLRVGLQRLLAEPGHITKAEVRDLLAATDPGGAS